MCPRSRDTPFSVAVRSRSFGPPGPEDDGGGDDEYDKEFDGDRDSDVGGGDYGFRQSGVHEHGCGAGDPSAGNDWLAATSHGRDAVRSGPGAAGTGFAASKNVARRCPTREKGDDKVPQGERVKIIAFLGCNDGARHPLSVDVVAWGSL